MEWKKMVISFILIVVILILLTAYWFAPFNSTEFVTNQPINSNFSLNSSLPQNPQFSSNMRYPTPDISYSLDTIECSLQRQDNIRTAMTIIENLTVLKFYQVDSDPEINISCNNSVIINNNYFVAGEGGPVNVTKTDNFNVITKGEVLLLSDSNCIGEPNVAIHELLHALGFAHSQNPNNVMYPISICSQTIGQDIPNIINQLYSVPSYPNLSIKDVSAVIYGRYLDTNITISNNGLEQSGNATITIYADGVVLDVQDIEPLEIGESITYMFNNIWVPNLKVSQLQYVIQSNFTELDKNNKEISLSVK